MDLELLPSAGRHNRLHFLGPNDLCIKKETKQYQLFTPRAKPLLLQKFFKKQETHRTLRNPKNKLPLKLGREK